MKKIMIIILIILTAYGFSQQTEDVNRNETMKVAMYIKFKGVAEQALDFYSKVFEEEILMREFYQEGITENEELIGKVFHAEIKIGSAYVYMSDEVMKKPNYKDFKIVVEAETLEDAQKYLDSLSEDGKINEPLKKMPWGMYHSNVTDQFGINWDIVFCK